MNNHLCWKEIAGIISATSLRRPRRPASLPNGSQPATYSLKILPLSPHSGKAKPAKRGRPRAALGLTEAGGEDAVVGRSPRDAKGRTPREGAGDLRGAGGRIGWKSALPTRRARGAKPNPLVPGRGEVGSPGTPRGRGWATPRAPATSRRARRR